MGEDAAYKAAAGAASAAAAAAAPLSVAGKNEPEGWLKFYNAFYLLQKLSEKYKGFRPDLEGEEADSESDEEVAEVVE
jgi:hypothetical protein